MQILTGAEIVVECLKEQGVDTVFGYPGGSILNIYDALYKHKEITHILTSHEQGASHAADGYARATGRVGVCFATSGPGATNLVTGIATAYMDSIPVVAITCNVGTSLLGKDSFQEVDIAGITTPSEAAREIATQLYQYGVRGFWNFANTDLHLPEDAVVENMHLAESLMRLSYSLYNNFYHEKLDENPFLEVMKK